jgi:hypothetical protein
LAEKNFVVRHGITVSSNTLTVNSSHVGINTGSASVTFHVAANDAILIPIGNTEQRPSGTEGMLRFNSETESFEGYSNGEWIDLASSVIDADTLDGVNSSNYARTDIDETFQSNLTTNGHIYIGTRDWPTLNLRANTGTGSTIVGAKGTSRRWVMTIGNDTAETGSNAGSDFQISRYDDSGNLVATALEISRATGELEVEGNLVWHAGNDGHGSGLDADTVDGIHASDLVGGGPGLGMNSVIRTNAMNIIEDITLADHTTTFTVDAGADTISVGTDDDYANGDTVVLETTGTLPAGLSVETVYYVRDVAAGTCKLAATYGGSVIDITDTGTGTHTIYQAINGSSAGPIAIESGATVTVPYGSTWVIV